MGAYKLEQVIGIVEPYWCDSSYSSIVEHANYIFQITIILLLRGNKT